MRFIHLTQVETNLKIAFNTDLIASIAETFYETMDKPKACIRCGSEDIYVKEDYADVIAKIEEVPPS